jgi:hypothetical protein
LKGRLGEAATKLDLSENDIIRHAVCAAVNAIEANDYKTEEEREFFKLQLTRDTNIAVPH